MTTMIIDCNDCAMQRTSACRECVVTAICGPDPDEALEIDAAEARAVRLLGRSGLVHPLRHQARRACA